MKGPRALFDEAAYFWRRRGSLRGLLGFAFVVDFLVLPGAIYLVFSLLERAKALTTPTALLRFVIWSLAAYFVANLVVVGVWLLWRKLPGISADRPAILFAPSSDAADEEVIERLYEEFGRDLAARGLGGIVTHSLVSRRMAVRTHAEAVALLADTGARLVIFGEAGGGTRGGTRTHGFSKISFTIRHSALDADQFPAIARTLAGALVLRAFAFSEANSFIEKRVVVANLSETARFFIAIALTLDNRAPEATQLLEELLQSVELRLKASGTNPQLNLFRKSIITALSMSLPQVFRQVYENELIPHIARREGDRAARRCKEILDRLATILNSPEALALTEAIINFHFGDLEGASRLVNTALRVTPSNDPAPHLSRAFLALWQEKYAAALKGYRRAGRCQLLNPEMIIGVIAFLDSIVAGFPTRPEIRFGLASVNDQFFDGTRAEEEYDRFLGDTNDTSKEGLWVLRRQAQERLESLRARQVEES